MVNKRAVLASLLATATAHAGGLGRPNQMSARGVGMGGAWVAFVDDATAVWFNPAAMTEIDPQVQVGAEVVVGPRSYTPIADDGTRGAPQEATAFAPVPVIGGVGRFTYNDRPSWFTLGGGIWNTYGGQISYPKTMMPALDSTQNAVLEAQIGTGLRLSDKFSIGASFRFGIGLFAVQGTRMPYDSDLSASGIGVSHIWSMHFRPTSKVKMGVVWRAPMNLTTTGSGTIDGASGLERVSVEHEQQWPQSAALGVGIHATPKLKIATQVDWVQWSTIKAITVSLPGSGNPTQNFRQDWRDSWSVRLGGELTVSEAVAIRAGGYFDSEAIIERSKERQYVDSNKFGVSAGGTVRFGKGWRVDVALDSLIPRPYTVKQNTADTPVHERNKGPGDYSSKLITVQGSVARVF